MSREEEAPFKLLLQPNSLQSSAFPFKSGFIALLGRPNVGKSTLLNTILGRKVAIVSEKAQTTRNRIMGVKNLPAAQIVFVDTPGIHQSIIPFNRRMVKTAFRASKDVDLILFMTDEDGELESEGGDRYILGSLQPGVTPVFLLINKVDVMDQAGLLKRIDRYNRAFSFSDSFPISALTGETVEHLQEVVVELMLPGPRYFPEGMYTDQPQAFWLGELIREKVFSSTHQEIPYSAAVNVEQVEERTSGLLFIGATIYLEKESQKGIVIGKGGRMLKKIGEMARKDIEAILGVPVYLDLWVKVRSDWKRDEAFLERLGLGR